jgi:hypothetical protein
MSLSSRDKYQIELNKSFEDELENYQQIIRLKEELLPYNIKFPIFFNYYNQLKLEEIEKKQESKDNIFPVPLEAKRETNPNIENEMNRVPCEVNKVIVTDKKLQEEEQLNEVKINLFFILKLKCNYNNEYHKMISNKYIKCKRLVIQNYDINNNKIEFHEKDYSFIPVFNKEGDVFNYGKYKIQFTKNNDKTSQITINDKIIMSEKEFQEKNKNIINLREEEKEYKAAKSSKKSNKSSISEIDNKNIINNIDNESIKTADNKKYEKPLSQTTPKRNDNNSNISETSDKEIDGLKFFDEKNRYIYKYYSKQIDEIYTNHELIKLSKKGNIELLKSLDLLKDSFDNSYDNKNDLQSHIIFKNFESNEIQRNIPFILEVKKSMAGLIELLIQIKEIAKVIKNVSNISLPNYIIGIICSFNKNQINNQINFLKKFYKDNSSETFLEHVMKIIEKNKLNILIGVIKDENIYGYPLGIDDYNIENENLTKRIDIDYFNRKVCKGEYDSKDLIKICEKYPYKSLSYEISDKYKLRKITQNYEKLQHNYDKLKEDFETIKSENAKLLQMLAEKKEK